MKNWFPSQAIGEIQIKATLRVHPNLVKDVIKKTNHKFWGGWGRRTLHTADTNVDQGGGRGPFTVAKL